MNFAIPDLPTPLAPLRIPPVTRACSIERSEKQGLKLKVLKETANFLRDHAEPRKLIVDPVRTWKDWSTGVAIPKRWRDPLTTKTTGREKAVININRNSSQITFSGGILEPTLLLHFEEMCRWHTSTNIGEEISVSFAQCTIPPELSRELTFIVDKYKDVLLHVTVPHDGAQQHLQEEINGIFTRKRARIDQEDRLKTETAKFKSELRTYKRFVVGSQAQRKDTVSEEALSRTSITRAYEKGFKAIAKAARLDYNKTYEEVAHANAERFLTSCLSDLCVQEARERFRRFVNKHQTLCLSWCLESELICRIMLRNTEKTDREAFVRKCNRSWGDSRITEIARNRSEAAERASFWEGFMQFHVGLQEEEKNERHVISDEFDSDAARISALEAERLVVAEEEQLGRELIEFNGQKTYYFKEIFDGIQARLVFERRIKQELFIKREQATRTKQKAAAAAQWMQFASISTFLIAMHQRFSHLRELGVLREKMLSELPVLTFEVPYSTDLPVHYLSHNVAPFPTRICDTGFFCIRPELSYLEQLHTSIAAHEDVLESLLVDIPPLPGHGYTEVYEALCERVAAYERAPPLQWYLTQKTLVSKWTFEISIDKMSRGECLTSDNGAGLTEQDGVWRWKSTESTLGVQYLTDACRQVSFTSHGSEGVEDAVEGEPLRFFSLSATVCLSGVPGTPETSVESRVKIEVRPPKISLNPHAPELFTDYTSETTDILKNLVFKGTELPRKTVLRVFLDKHVEFLTQNAREKIRFVTGRDVAITEENEIIYRSTRVGSLELRETGLEMTVNPSTAVDVLNRLARCVKYCIPQGGKPIIGERKTMVEYDDGAGVSRIRVGMTVRHVDQPTTVTLPVAKVLYHQAMTRTLSDILQQAPAGGCTVHVFPKASVTDPDTEYFSGGHMTVTLSGVTGRYDSLVLNSDRNAVVFDHAAKKIYQGSQEVGTFRFEGHHVDGAVVELLKNAVKKAKLTTFLSQAPEPPRRRVESLDPLAPPPDSEFPSWKKKVRRIFCMISAVSHLVRGSFTKKVARKVTIFFSEKTPLSVVAMILNAFKYGVLIGPERVGIRNISVSLQLGQSIMSKLTDDGLHDVLSEETTPVFLKQTQVKVTGPLISVIGKYALRYKEGSGAVRLAGFDIHPDLDSIPLPSFTFVFKLFTSDEEDSLCLAAKDSVVRHHPIEDHNDGEGSTLPSAERSLTRAPDSPVSPGKTSTKLNKLRTKLHEKITQKLDGNLAGVLGTHVKNEKVRTGNKTKDHAILVDGKQIGVAQYVGNNNMHTFVLSLQSGVKRKCLISVLRAVCFENSSSCPASDKRRVLISASLKGNHVASLGMTVSVLEVDDVTVINMEAPNLAYRAVHNEASQPFMIAPLYSTTISDPDTQFFDHGQLVIENISGGHKGDTLTLLSKQQQVDMIARTKPNTLSIFSKHFISDPSACLFEVREGKYLHLCGENATQIAQLFNPKSKNSLAGRSLCINFDSCRSNNGTEKFVTIDILMFILNCVCYSNSEYTTIGGKAIISNFQIRVSDGFNSLEGKKRFTLKLLAPLIGLPGFHSTATIQSPIQYVRLYPVLTLNVSPNHSFTKGFVSVRLDTSFASSSPSLLLSLDISQLGLKLVNNGLYVSAVLVCFVEAFSPHCIRLEFTQGCKCSAKQLLSLLRAIEVRSDMGTPGTAQAVLTTCEGDDRVLSCTTKIVVG